MAHYIYQLLYVVAYYICQLYGRIDWVGQKCVCVVCVGCMHGWCVWLVCMGDSVGLGEGLVRYS